MLTPSEAAVEVVNRKGSEDTLEVEGRGVRDLESGAFYEPSSVRDAIGWAYAGEWDSDGTCPKASRLAQWWHNRGQGS